MRQSEADNDMNKEPEEFTALEAVTNVQMEKPYVLRSLRARFSDL
jgi:hypothetical protein